MPAHAFMASGHCAQTHGLYMHGMSHATPPSVESHTNHSALSHEAHNHVVNNIHKQVNPPSHELVLIGFG